MCHEMGLADMSEVNKRIRFVVTLLKHRILLPFFLSNQYVRDLKWINIEFSSKCNLRCKWCSLDHAKPATYMSPEILARVIDEIADNTKFQIETIDLHNAGETLLHPNFQELVTLLGRKKGAARRFPKVNLLTNGILLDKDNSHFILASRAIDLLRVSIDGGSPTAYEELRRGGRWNTLSANVKLFMEAKQSYSSAPVTGAICIVPPDKPFNQTWMDPEFLALLALFDSVELRPPHNWDGSKELGISSDALKAYENDNRGKMCKFLAHSLVILPNGDVTVCCADLNSRGVIGNVRQNTLEEVSQAKMRRRMIEKFAIGRKHAISLCANCTGYY